MKKPLFAVPLMLVMLGAGCSTAPSPTPTPSGTPTVPSATAPTPTAPTPPPAASGQVTATFTGAASLSGTFDGECRPYFPAQNKGILFQAQNINGYWLQVGNSDARPEGTNPAINVGVLNGPGKSYTLDMSRPYHIVFGPGLKTATIKADFKEVLKDNYITVQASFNCP